MIDLKQLGQVVQDLLSIKRQTERFISHSVALLKLIEAQSLFMFIRTIAILLDLRT